eukprot:TRINITY_DN7471_c0_g1_i1.p1 TRINITY_DN7471_c0_g1~~TRINITY_DN7471_c0_g1_i1.p1  ORF type:complete len:262 (+),score=9.86 TRINITY_DN7471_c0_g1_i1:110-895(+)
MIRRPPRSTQGVSSAASDVYKRQAYNFSQFIFQRIFLFIFRSFLLYFFHFLITFEILLSEFLFSLQRIFALLLLQVLSFKFFVKIFQSFILVFEFNLFFFFYNLICIRETEIFNIFNFFILINQLIKAEILINIVVSSKFDIFYFSLFFQYFLIVSFFIFSKLDISLFDKFLYLIIFVNFGLLFQFFFYFDMLFFFLFFRNTAKGMISPFQKAFKLSLSNNFHILTDLLQFSRVFGQFQVFSCFWVYFQFNRLFQKLKRIY